jgi:hypothetical protein
MLAKVQLKIESSLIAIALGIHSLPVCPNKLLYVWNQDPNVLVSREDILFRKPAIFKHVSEGVLIVPDSSFTVLVNHRLRCPTPWQHRKVRGYPLESPREREDREDDFCHGVVDKDTGTENRLACDAAFMHIDQGVDHLLVPRRETWWRHYDQ